MAETIAFVGLAAAIVQFVDFSAKIIKRLDEFVAATDNIPECFRDIKAQLPLIVNTLHSIRVQAESQHLSEVAANALKAVVDRSVEEAHTLIVILDKALPKGPSSTFQVRLQALKSLACDKKVQKSVDRLLQHIQVLNFSQNTNSCETIGRLSQELSKSSITSSNTTSTFSFGLNIGNAPQIRDGAFIGRESEIEQLKEYLSPQNTVSTQKVVAITGMGGLGKTQLSLAFAKQYHHEYSSIFWLNAKDESTIKQSLVSLSRIIFSSAQSSSTSGHADEDQIIHQIRQWFSQQGNDRWLLLLDNYDDPKLPSIKSSTGYDIRLYFPFRSQGAILITTRSRQLRFAREVELHKLDNEHQNLEILSNRSRRNMENDPDAIKLVKRLNGLPLALATAGVYLSQSSESVNEYLDAYETEWQELSDNAKELLEYGDRTLFSTWSLSLDQVRARDADTAELMRLLAYFGPQDIRYELFQRAADHGLPWLSALTENKRRFHRALALLHEYSLIEVSATGYSLHHCVHDWALQALNRVINEQYFRVALRGIASNVRTEHDKDYWQNNRMLVEHAIRLEHHRFSSFLNGETLDHSCLQDLWLLGILWATQGDHLRAEPFLVRAFAGMKRELGTKHISTLRSAIDLGNLYLNQGRLSDSEQVYQLVLEEQETLGPDHQALLTTCNNLGSTYYSQHRLVEAQQQYERALNGFEEVLGLHSVYTLQTVDNIGLVYLCQGEMEHAEKMFKRAVTGYEDALGPDHPRTLAAYHHLGELYYCEGRLADAETMLHRVLVGRTRVLGPEHFKTVNTVSSLGALYVKQGRVLGAERMWQQAIAEFEKMPGLQAQLDKQCHNLGRLYYDQNRLEEAARIYQQVLERSAKGGETSGFHRGILLGTARDLAALYHGQGKNHEAEELESRYDWSDLQEDQWPHF
ncbi:hypothetical protein GJ744_003077 [Endocarpon pusillum]|uniref:NACHT-NTPase and P-loop NTPases N-terminal domain-containing protein n=1 Tax=Endocarpon pusillum TaxID=364733 RepID=A0A8H7APA9_9EURO|nr:hypothetical protein GJ744_003077 [Endocarpon pusillum]